MHDYLSAQSFHTLACYDVYEVSLIQQESTLHMT